MSRRKTRRGKRYHVHNGNGRLMLSRKGGSLRFQLRSLVAWTDQECPFCGVFLASRKSWHEHLFGRNGEGPRCPKVRGWLRQRNRPVGRRRRWRLQTFPV